MQSVSITTDVVGSTLAQGRSVFVNKNIPRMRTCNHWGCVPILCCCLIPSGNETVPDDIFSILLFILYNVHLFEGDGNQLFFFSLFVTHDFQLLQIYILFWINVYHLKIKKINPIACRKKDIWKKYVEYEKKNNWLPSPSKRCTLYRINNNIE
jgi:hypothetical protein